jgi:hypothetical protein
MQTILYVQDGGSIIDPERFDITADFEYNCTPRLRREVRQIIFEHLDPIVAAGQEHFGGNHAK